MKYTSEINHIFRNRVSLLTTIDINLIFVLLCLFLGYSSNHTGYLCLSLKVALTSHSMWFSMKICFLLHYQ